MGTTIKTAPWLGKAMVYAAVIVAMGFESVAVAQSGYPPAPADGALRIVAWNIEHLGIRNLAGPRPIRTPEQLAMLAARLVDFGAAVYCFQEIRVESVFDEVVAMMGPSYSSWYGGSDNCFVYDITKVQLLSAELLIDLTEPPYSTYYADHPEAVSPNYPFVPGIRVMGTGVFEAVDGQSEPFRAISVHNHWSSSLCRQYEGVATNYYIDELLQDPAETPYIFLAGDFNANTFYAPHPQLAVGGFLHRVPGNNLEIDYIYATTATLPLIPGGSMVRMLPSYFGESSTYFVNNYSDHYPLYVDFVPEAIPFPTASITVPLGRTWCEVGDSLTLEVSVENTTGVVQYQWLKDDQELAGEDSATLELVNVSSADTGVYQVRITDETGGKAVFYSGLVDVAVFEPGVLPATALWGLAVMVGLVAVASVRRLRTTGRD